MREQGEKFARLARVGDEENGVAVVYGAEVSVEGFGWV